MKRKTLTCLVILIFAVGSMSAQDVNIETEPSSQAPRVRSPLSLSLGFNPGIILPLGDDSDYYNLGGNFTLAGAFSLPSLPFVFFPVQAGYNVYERK